MGTNRIAADDESGFIKDWVQELSSGHASALRSFIESQRSEIKSNDRLAREAAVKRICLVLSKLPQSYSWQLPQVELLLDFLLMNYDTFDSPDCTVLAAIKSLVMNGPRLTAGYIQIIVEKLFHQGQVQTCAQKERFLFFQILDILLNKYHEELSANVYFVSYFISSISGEKDPRCLVLVFALFCTICNHFNSGKFPRNLFDIHAYDLFDLIACYYPIEFKNSSKEGTEITRELLVIGCEQCLLADEEFAPFVFQLIVEKLTDDEYSLSTKLEVCTFLAKACSVFSARELRDHVGELCAGIRSVLFNLPKSSLSDGIPQPIDVAISSVLETLEKGISKDRKERIEHVCQEFIENSEMFVLQAELGLTGRVLSFFEILVRSSEYSVGIVFESVFSWLLSLCKGDTANSAVNKSEIIDDSLKILCHWIDLACHFKQVTLMQKYHSSFIEMLDKYDREIAQLTRYQLLKACIDMHVQTDGLQEKCKVFLRKSVNFVHGQNEELRKMCLAFVHAFAISDWATVKTVLSDEISAGAGSPYLTPIIWSMIHDSESLDFALSHLITLLPSTSAWLDDFQEAFIEMLKWNKSRNSALQKRLLKHILECFFTRVVPEAMSVIEMEALALFLQQIGLVIDDRIHLEGLHLIQERLKDCPASLPGLYLYVLQSSESDELLSLVAQLSSVGQELTWYRFLILAAVVNKSPNYSIMLARTNEILENIHFVDSFKCKCRLCAALLLAGRTEGALFFTELLDDLVEHFDSTDSPSLTDAMTDMLTFDKCYSDPVKCKYRTTVLWQQRIFCQLVPIYVQYFNSLESHSKRVALFALLSPLFTLAGSSTAAMNDKYIELLPVLCAALDTVGLDASSEESLILGLAKLLKNATSNELDGDFLVKVLPRLQHSLDSSGDMKVHLATLECLQSIAQRWPPAVLLPYYSSVVRCLTQTSGSQKRIVRRAVANAKNLWELLPTK